MAFAIWTISLPLGAQTVVENSSAWKYLHPVDGVDPATADRDFHSTFATLDFDDSNWRTGKDSPGVRGGFGYGDPPSGVDIGLPTSNNRKTAYFRHRFKTTEQHTDLVLKCQRDDAIIVYLDGQEVARDNLPPGRDVYDLFAAQTVSGAGETAVVKLRLKKLILPPGDHVLAISLHNRPQGSSDLRIAEISLAVEPRSEADEEDPEQDLF